jgi:hypothetical protein
MDSKRYILNSLHYGNDLIHINSLDDVKVGGIYAYNENSRLMFRYIVSVGSGHYRFRTMERRTFHLNERVRLGSTHQMWRLSDDLLSQVTAYVSLQAL